MNSVDIASAVLGLASILDPRIPDPDENGLRVQAWADCFEGQGVYPSEALEAVRIHYRKPNSFPIKPGDVIAAIAAMPINSSPERLRAFMNKWSNYPYSTVIQELTGTSWTPSYPTPEGIHGDVEAEKAYHKAEFREWLRENGNELIRAAMNNPKPPALER